MKTSDVDKMKVEALREYLKKLIKALDLADCDDMFGGKGWRYYLMDEDA